MMIILSCWFCVCGFWFSAGSGGIEKIMTSRINVNFSASKLIIT